MMEEIHVDKIYTIKRSHVAFLLFTFLITNQFFNIFIIPIHVLRILNWAYCLCLVFCVFFWYISGKLDVTWLRQWRYIQKFLLIILLSYIYLLFENQSISDTFRVTITWFGYLILFVLLKKNYNQHEIFRALTIFSFVWFFAWIVGFLSPIPLYDASGVYDEQQLMSTGRGIIRLKVSGQGLMNLWGLWCLSIYIKRKNALYLLAYFMCLLFVVLCVSRQHIVMYSLIGILFLFYKISFFKKILLAVLIYVIMNIILPQTEIYQNLIELTSQQMIDNNGGKEDVRIQAINYYIVDYPHNIYTILFGHGEYHSHSSYGIHIYHIMSRTGYILADVGFAGIYFYYGIFGLLCFFSLLYDVLKTDIDQDKYGIKLFIYYLFLTNIFSHSFDVNQISLALSLYLLYTYKKPGNQLFLNKSIT